jgi:hypothetical protein
MPGHAPLKEAVPLSLEQEAYIGLGRNGYGVVPICFRIGGELDLPALQRALNLVVARHEPLRMRLVDTPDGLRQVFQPTADEDCTIREIDTADGQTAQELAAELAEAPNGARLTGPLLSWLIRSGSGETLLLLLTDHLAIDGWSMGIFARELLSSYYAEVSGTGPVPLPAVYPYSDYIAGQLAEVDWAPGQYEYWRRVGHDYTRASFRRPVGDPVGPPDQRGRSDFNCVLSPEETEQLVEFARIAVVPPRAVECAAPILALWAWSRPSLIGMWCMHSGRENVAITNTIGNFVRSFLMVTPIDSADTLAQFTRDVLSQWSEAVGQAKLPFSTGVMRRLIAQAGGTDPAMPEMWLNAVAPPPGTSISDGPFPISESATAEYIDIEATRWGWYRESRLRFMSTFDKSLSMRVIFNPGQLSPSFVEAVTANLDLVLPLFAPEHANRPIGELVKLLGL